jgi:hypothetical protein
MLRWLRRWRARDDQHLVKRTEPVPSLDPIEELARMVGRRKSAMLTTSGGFIIPCGAIEPRLINDRGPIGGSVRNAAHSIQAFAPGPFVLPTHFSLFGPFVAGV